MNTRMSKYNTIHLYNPIHLTALELKSQLHLGTGTTNKTVKLLLKKIVTILKNLKCLGDVIKFKVDSAQFTDVSPLKARW
jgi:hypothetical protein